MTQIPNRKVFQSPDPLYIRHYFLAQNTTEKKNYRCSLQRLDWYVRVNQLLLHFMIYLYVVTFVPWNHYVVIRTSMDKIDTHHSQRQIQRFPEERTLDWPKMGLVLSSLSHFRYNQLNYSDIKRRGGTPAPNPPLRVYVVQLYIHVVFHAS